MAETQESTYAPGRGPGALALSDDALAQLLGAHQMGILATNKRSGHPQLSNVAYVWDASERIARISTTADRLKVRQLQRDPGLPCMRPAGTSCLTSSLRVRRNSHP
jgi:hypothetical protein